MTEPPRPGSPYQGPGSPYDGPTEQFPNSYPAYSGYPAPAYQNPTQELPNDWAYATQQPLQAPPPPQPPKSPKSPKWLWFAAGAALLLVIGLVGALVITSNSSSTDEDQAGDITATEPTAAAPSRTSTAPSTSSTTTRSPSPSSSTPLVPPTSSPSGATENITYEVTGEGVALTITYIDTDSVLQVLYNVSLPWSADVALESPASEAASVVVLNVGREVTCSITVDGAVVSTNTNSGLTTCSRVR